MCWCFGGCVCLSLLASSRIKRCTRVPCALRKIYCVCARVSIGRRYPHSYTTKRPPLTDKMLQRTYSAKPFRFINFRNKFRSLQPLLCIHFAAAGRRARRVNFYPAHYVIKLPILSAWEHEFWILDYWIIMGLGVYFSKLMLILLLGNVKTHWQLVQILV